MASQIERHSYQNQAHVAANFGAAAAQKRHLRVLERQLAAVLHIGLAHMSALHMYRPQAAVYLAMAVLMDTRLGAHTTLMLRSLMARMTGSSSSRGPHSTSSGPRHSASARAGQGVDVESGQAMTQPLLRVENGDGHGQAVQDEEEGEEDVDVQAEREAVQAEGAGAGHTVSEHTPVYCCA